MENDIQNLANNDRKKIVRALNRNPRVVLVRQRNGRVRVYELEKYEGHRLGMKQVIRAYKPWVKRQKSILGPLGGRELGVAADLSRAAIYEAG